MPPIVRVLGLPFLACVPLVAMLGYLGIHVLKREVIFIDLALAQIAVVGAIAAHLAFHAHGDSVVGYGCALGAVLLAAGFYAVVRQRVAELPLEAVIGVTYAIAAAGALFLVGIAPGGHVHVHEMLAGSILWTTWRDVGGCAGAFGGVAVAFALVRRPLRRLSEDYEGAVRAGMWVSWWDFVFYALVGVVIVVAVRVAGVVLVFGFLIIPATIAALFVTGWGRRLAIAWASGTVASVGGLVFAYTLDFSVGPAVALFLGLALVVAAVARRLRPA